MTSRCTCEETCHYENFMYYSTTKNTLTRERPYARERRKNTEVALTPVEDVAADLGHLLAQGEVQVLPGLHPDAVVHLLRLLAQEQEHRERVVSLVSEDLGCFCVVFANAASFCCAARL